MRNDADRGAKLASFRAKGTAYLKIVKMGHTELQDAVPMTGQEFMRSPRRSTTNPPVKDSEKYLYAENMGATAIGTGINVPKGYVEVCAAELAKASPSFRARRCGTWDQQVTWWFKARASRSSSRDPERPDPADFAPRAGWPRSICRPSSPDPSCPAVNPVVPEVVGTLSSAS